MGNDDSEGLLRVIDMMRELERYLAILYSIAASGIKDPYISAVMRKISIESAMHGYTLTMLKPLIRECPPKKVLDIETLVSLQGSIEEALTHTRSLIDFMDSMTKTSNDITNSVVDKLTELENYEESAVKIYSFLLRSYLPITSTRVDSKYRVSSKLIVKLLKSISDDERHHNELLQSVRELIMERK